MKVKEYRKQYADNPAQNLLRQITRVGDSGRLLSEVFEQGHPTTIFGKISVRNSKTI